MWRRYLLSLVLVCASLFLLGGLPGKAVAQVRTTNAHLLDRPAGFDDLAALVRRTHIPVRLYDLTGPDSLMAGEEGVFGASANIDTASLPIRFRWDFGDGTTASSLYARHRFEAPGTYSVTFSISNDFDEATDTLVVPVLPAEEAERR